jgi:branched-chain amino acid transport system ATP-binding protein
MKSIFDLCDYIVVMDYGKKISEDSPALVSQDEKVIQAYLGRSKEPGGKDSNWFV